MVNTLTKLNNFCIDESDIQAEALARDVNNTIKNANGFLEMITDNENCTLLI